MRKSWLALGAVAVVFLAFMLGPRADVAFTSKALTLPESLDAYLAAREAQVDDLIPDTEARIVWAYEDQRTTPLSIVYLHGFSATRQEIVPVCDSLAARLGANLYYARLSGHGRTTETALGEATAEAWLHDAQESIAIGRRLGERVVLIGTSTGGTLATWLLGQQPSDDVAATVLISPNYHPADPSASLLQWPWGQQIGEAVIGPFHTWEPANDLQARFWTTRYPTEALVEMMALVGLVDDMELSTINIPVMLVYSPNDEVVDAALSLARFQEMSHPANRILRVDSAGDRSNHVLAGDILSPSMTMPLTDSVSAFIEAVVR